MARLSDTSNDSIHIVNCSSLLIPGLRGANFTFVSECIVASSAFVYYLGLFILSISQLAYQYVQGGTSMLFLVGALVVTINIFTNESDFDVREIYRLASGVLIGLFLLVYGAFRFFKKPALLNITSQSQRHENHDTSLPPLGANQPAMGTAVGVLTFPLIVMELFLVSGSRGITEPGEKRISLFNNSAIITYTIQKTIQALIYTFLRNRIVKWRLRFQAAFYLKIISFFNFTMWIDSLANSESDLRLTQSTKVYGPGFKIASTIYEALLIDYRLLCSLLFLEHALDIERSENNKDEPKDDTRLLTEQLSEDHSPPVPSQHTIVVQMLTIEEKQLRIVGIATGLTCLLLQIIRGLQYIENLHMSPWIHLLAVLVDLIIFISGVLLLRFNKLTAEQNTQQQRRHISAIDVMVSGMGAVGFLYWSLKSLLTIYWVFAYQDEPSQQVYFSCSVAKDLIRGLVTAFLISVYLKVNEHVIVTCNHDVTYNHVILPVLMIGSLSVFVGSAMDQYVGQIDTMLGCEVKSQSLALLLKAGPPIHLGFCIHLFIHFMVIHSKMGRVWLSVGNQNDTALTEPLLNSESMERRQSSTKSEEKY